MEADHTSLDRLSIELDAASEDLNFKQLYYFHAVATEGSIARAAKRLKVTSGTISEQIKNLEEYLELELFDRGGSSLRLNAGGRRVFEHTKVMFRAARRLIQEVNPRRSKDRFVLEVGLCPTISKTFSAERFLPLFQLESVAPRLRHGDYDYLLKELLAGDLDLILTVNSPAGVDEKRIGTRALQESPLVCVARPDVAERIGKYPSGLEHVPFVNYIPGSRYRMEIDTFFLDHAIGPEIIGEVDDLILMVAAALRGLCAVVVPESSVKGLVKRGELVRLGAVNQAQSTVYAQYQQVSTTELVLKALDALLNSDTEVDDTI